MAINWKKTQQNLHERGFDIAVDGVVGPKTLRALLDAITGGTPASVAPALLNHLSKLDTPARLSSFIAQCAHESGKFKVVSENLNYGSAGLLKTFGKYFTPAQAKAYERKPEAIANRVYANRMGNGDEKSGDGWKFRGGGYIQNTGKNNYTAFAKWARISLDEAVVYVRTPEGAMASAMWYWDTRGLNSYADKMNIIGQTQAINGGLNGIKDRMDLYNKAMSIIA